MEDVQYCGGCSVLWRMFSIVEDVQYCWGYHQYCWDTYHHCNWESGILSMVKYCRVCSVVWGITTIVEAISIIYDRGNQKHCEMISKMLVVSLQRTEWYPPLHWWYLIEVMDILHSTEQRLLVLLELPRGFWAMKIGHNNSDIWDD